jgi:hypothetical protein
MSDLNPQTKAVDEIAKIQTPSQDPNDYSLDQLLRMIRLERSNSLNNQYKSALNKLRLGQLKISILTELRRYISLSKDKDGKFDASDKDFQNLITKSKDKYKSLNDELIKSGETIEGMETFGDFLEEIGIKDGKKSYNAEETKALLEAIKMTTDQISPLNEMHMQTISRIEGEINETYQMLIAALKPINNAITMHARGAKGG